MIRSTEQPIALLPPHNQHVQIRGTRVLYYEHTIFRSRNISPNICSKTWRILMTQPWICKSAFISYTTKIIQITFWFRIQINDNNDDKTSWLAATALTYEVQFHDYKDYFIFFRAGSFESVALMRKLLCTQAIMHHALNTFTCHIAYV